MKLRWLVAFVIIATAGAAYANNRHKPTIKNTGKRGTEIKATGGAAVGYYFWEDGVTSAYWLDPATTIWTGSVLAGLDDDTVSLTVANNFLFGIFGVAYNLRKSPVFVNTNGFITIALDPGDPAISYSPDMPNENAPNNTVAPFWTDLELKDATGANTAVYYLDDSPSKLVLYYPARDVINTASVYYFQIWLMVGDTIIFSYSANSSTYDAASNKEIGVENGDGSISVELNATTIDNALAANSYYWVKFYYKDTYVQSFEEISPPAGWQIGTGSGAWTFGSTDHAILETASAKFNSSTFTGAGAPLVTPRLDLKYAGNPYLIFYLYHTRTNATKPDSLYVDVSYDGGLTWSQIAGYSRYGYYNGWEKIRVNLGAYIGYSNVKVRFRPVAAGGEDIYIDAVKIYTDYHQDVDLEHVYYPEDYLLPISSTDTPDSIKFTLKNWGDQDITGDVEWAYFDGTAWVESTITTQTILAGQEVEFVRGLTADNSSIESLKVDFQSADDQDNLSNILVWSVQRSNWARWDDGTPEGYISYNKFAVEFKNPYSATNIDSIGIYIASVVTPATFDSVYITDDNAGTPGAVLAVKTNVEVTGTGWLWIPLDEPLNHNDGHLWVVAVQSSNNIAVATDKSNPSGFSAYYDPTSGWIRVTSEDYMVRLHIVKKPPNDATVAAIYYDKYVDSHVSTLSDYTSNYTIRPKVLIKNVGSNDLDDVEVRWDYSTDNGVTWNTVSTEQIGTAILAGDSTYYTFVNGYDASLDADGTQYLIRALITQVEQAGVWVADDNPSNNTLTASDSILKDTVHAGMDDASGWKWEDNVGDVYADIAVDSSFWDYVTTGEADDTLALGDYGTQKVGLPFLVNFFGVNYDSVYIGANGAIDFVSSDIPDDNADLSTYLGTDKALVAAFWEDLVTKASVFTPPDELIYLKTSADGTLPDTFAVTWYNVQLENTGEAFTFQILIIDNISGSTEGYTDIVFQYLKPFSYTADSADPTIGIYNNVGSGIYYAQYSYDEAPVGLVGNLWLTAPSAIYWKNPTPTEVSESDNGIPKTFALAPVKPNPVSGMATINFALPKEANVSIDVYDATGRIVTNIASGRFSAGYHNVSWNPEHMSSGIYFIRMKADNFIKTRRVVVMK